MFGKNLVPTQFGFPKLIRVLEAIPDTIRVSCSCLLNIHTQCWAFLFNVCHILPFQLVGKGASRVAVLKKPIAGTVHIYMYMYIWNAHVQYMCIHALLLWLVLL